MRNKYKHTIAVLVGFVLIFSSFMHRSLDFAETATGQVLGETVVLARGPEALAVAVPPLLLQDNSALLERIRAESYVVYDDATKTVLAEKHASAKLPIASLTKLMTVLVAYTYLDPQAAVTIQPNYTFAVSPTLGLVVGDEVKVQDLMQAVLVGSANDAALALSHLAGSASGVSFIELMNKYAQDLGMVNTQFSNALGFDSYYNYSTASDLALLVQKCLDLGLFELTGRMPKFSFTGSRGFTYSVRATNKLLAKHADIQAVKTGWTAGAQGAMVTKILNNGNPFVIIVLGSPNREADTLTLKNVISSTYAWPE